MKALRGVVSDGFHAAVHHHRVQQGADFDLGVRDALEPHRLFHTWNAVVRFGPHHHGVKTITTKGHVITTGQGKWVVTQAIGIQQAVGGARWQQRHRDGLIGQCKSHVETIITGTAQQGVIAQAPKEVIVSVATFQSVSASHAQHQSTAIASIVESHTCLLPSFDGVGAVMPQQLVGIVITRQIDSGRVQRRGGGARLDRQVPAGAFNHLMNHQTFNRGVTIQRIGNIGQDLVEPRIPCRFDHFVTRVVHKVAVVTAVTDHRIGTRTAVQSISASIPDGAWRYRNPIADHLKRPTLFF